MDAVSTGPLNKEALHAAGHRFPGHTHGGQLMLTGHLGAGSLFYRYWSGLYSRRSGALVVSNGVGNWFPVRIQAPAEILHLTLRRAGLPKA